MKNTNQRKTSITEQLRGLGFTEKQIKSFRNWLNYRFSGFRQINLVSIVNGEKIRFYETGCVFEVALSHFGIY